MEEDAPQKKLLLLEVHVRETLRKFEDDGPVSISFDHSIIKCLRGLINFEPRFDFLMERLLERANKLLIADALRTAVHSGFPIWTKSDGHFHRVHSREIHRTEFDWAHAIETSEFRTKILTESKFEGVNLWATVADWELLCFQSDQNEQFQSSSPLGRPAGSGGFTVSDAPLVELMIADMKEDPSLSSHAAALRYADQAKGGSTIESKAKRLMGRLKERDISN